MARYQRKMKRRTSTRRTLTLERLGPAGGARILRLEPMEPRVLLTHVAPQLNAADTTSFSALQENTLIANNPGQPVSTLFQGKAIATTPPVGNDFAYFDSTSDEGIAVTGVNDLQDGVWEYSTDGGDNWRILGGNTSPANAVVLSAADANDRIRFLPDGNFTGTVSLEFAAWDASDGLSPGTSVDLTAPGATGGSSAYSTSTVTATLDVSAAAIPPSFSLFPVQHDLLENYADAYNPGGTDSGAINVTFVHDIQLGNGGNNTVNFNVGDTMGYVVNSSVDQSGNIYVHLKQGAWGIDTLTVSAINGSVTSPVQTAAFYIDQVTPPSFTASNLFTYPNGGAKSLLDWAANVTDGDGGSGGTLTYTIYSDSNPGLFTSAPSIDGSGMLNFTPGGTVGTDTVQAQLYNNANNAFSAPVQFYIGVDNLPSFTLTQTSFTTVGGGAAQTVPGEATSLNSGTADDNDPLSFDLSASNISVFSVEPAIDSNGTLTFTPAAVVTQSTTVTVNAFLVNGFDNFYSSQTFSITVEAQPSFTLTDPPSIVESPSPAPQSVLNTAANISSGNGSGDSLNFVVSGDTNPELFSAAPTITPTGTLSYTPKASFSGQAVITVYLQDLTDGANSVTETFPISIYAPPNTVPETYVVYPSSYASAAVSIGLLSHDSDPNSSFDGGSAMTVATASNGTYGQVVSSPNGTFLYAPNSGFYGYDQFTYKAQAGPAISAPVTVTVYTWYTAMVEKVFTELLGRAPSTGSSGDLQYWGGQLQAGMSMGTFASDIMASTEHENDVVAQVFDDFLGRAPTQGDLSYWGPLYAQYGGPEEIINEVASTAESYSHAGGTQAGWVTLIYQQCLNRNPSQSDLNSWANASQQTVMNAIVGSPKNHIAACPEYQSDVIGADFNLFLGRSPTSTDRNGWESQFDAGVTRVTLDETLISSAEYEGEPPAPTSGDAVLWKW